MPGAGIGLSERFRDPILKGSGSHSPRVQVPTCRIFSRDHDYDS